MEFSELNVEYGDSYESAAIVGDDIWAVHPHFAADDESARLFERLGAHPTTIDGEPATYFAVWAPGAGAMAVIVHHRACSRGGLPSSAQRRRHVRPDDEIETIDMTDWVLASGRARVQAAVAVRFELSLPRRVWCRPGTLVAVEGEGRDRSS